MNTEQILLGMKIYSKEGMIFMLDKEEQLLLLEYINNIEKENQNITLNKIAEKLHLLNNEKLKQDNEDSE